MLYTLYRLRDEVFPVGHVVSLCLFLSEHITDILLYIHIYIPTMQYSKETEDFPLHEQLLAAGRDNVPYQSISISRYILSLSLSLFMHKYSEVWSL